MIEENVYEKLREKISLWPIKVQKTREIMEIFRVLFTEEEARFLMHFTAPYQNAETMEQIVEGTGLPRERIETIVDRLVSRGLLFRFKSKRDGSIRYSLMPMIPGIFEFYFSSGRDSDEKRKVGELFERYLVNGGGLETGASDYPFD